MMHVYIFRCKSMCVNKCNFVQLVLGVCLCIDNSNRIQVCVWKGNEELFDVSSLTTDIMGAC